MSALGGRCYPTRGQRRPAFEPEKGPPECTYDGECELRGCGNACMNYRVPPFVSTCEGYEWLDEHPLCGCVEGHCTFFAL